MWWWWWVQVGKGDAHPLKERLRAWCGRMHRRAAAQAGAAAAPHFSCLEPEMPYLTAKLELHQASITLANCTHHVAHMLPRFGWRSISRVFADSDLDSTTIRSVISEDSVAADTPQWDGRIPAGEAIVATAEVGLFVMVRQCERVLERCITMPKFLVLLDFPSDVSIELPEEVSCTSLVSVPPPPLFHPRPTPEHPTAL